MLKSNKQIIAMPEKKCQVPGTSSGSYLSEEKPKEVTVDEAIFCDSRFSGIVRNFISSAGKLHYNFKQSQMKYALNYPSILTTDNNEYVNARVSDSQSHKLRRQMVIDTFKLLFMDVDETSVLRKLSTIEYAVKSEDILTPGMIDDLRSKLQSNNYFFPQVRDLLRDEEKLEISQWVLAILNDLKALSVLEKNSKQGGVLGFNRLIRLLKKPESSVVNRLTWNLLPQKLIDNIPKKRYHDLYKSFKDSYNSYVQHRSTFDIETVIEFCRSFTSVDNLLDLSVRNHDEESREKYKRMICDAFEQKKLLQFGMTVLVIFVLG